MEITIAQVKQQLDDHEKHCDERHRVLDHKMAEFSADMKNMKENMAELREDMRVLRTEFTALRGEFTSLRGDVDRKIDALRKDVRSDLKWGLGISVAFMSFVMGAVTWISQMPGI